MWFHSSGFRVLDLAHDVFIHWVTSPEKTIVIPLHSFDFFLKTCLQISPSQWSSWGVTSHRNIYLTRSIKMSFKRYTCVNEGQLINLVLCIKNVVKLYISTSLPGVVCLLRSSEPSLCSSSLPSVHTPGCSPPMSPVTAQMETERRDNGGTKQHRTVLAAWTKGKTHLMIYKTCAITLILPLNKQYPAVKQSFSPWGVCCPVPG